MLRPMIQAMDDTAVSVTCSTDDVYQGTPLTFGGVESADELRAIPPIFRAAKR